MTGPIDVFLVAGQSNAQGRGTSGDAPAVTHPDSLQFWNGALAALADPVGNANTGSAWPSFANAITDLSELPICIVPAAVGGTPLLAASGGTNGNWSPTGTLFTTAVNRTNATLAALTAAGWEPTLRGVLWHQGEQDAGDYPTPATIKADYKAALLALHTRFETSLGGSFKLYVFRLGRLFSSDGQAWQDVRAAQDEACEEADDLEMVYTRAVDFPSLGWMKTDGIHYAQPGLNDMGTVGGQVIASDLGYVDEPPPPAPISRTSRTAERLLLL